MPSKVAVIIVSKFQQYVPFITIHRNGKIVQDLPSAHHNFEHKLAQMRNSGEKGD